MYERPFGLYSARTRPIYNSLSWTYMSYSTTKLGPIACYTVPDVGVPTPVTWADYGFRSFGRSDLVRRKKPKGIDQLRQATAVSYTLQERFDAPIVFRQGKSTVYSSVCQDTGGATLGYGGETLPSTDEVLRNKLLAKAKAATVNLANALGEYRQTATLFRDAATFVARSARALKARDPRMLYDPRSSLSSKMSNAVLVTQYGIRPLVSDVLGSIEVLKQASDRPLYFRSNASTTDRLERRYTIYNSSAKPESVVCTLDKRSSAWSLVELNNQVLHQTLGQFGFTNPLGVAWELVPFSFVVDWFFNVGEFLASLDNCLYFKNGIYQISTREDYKRVAKVRGAMGYYHRRQSTRSSVKGLGVVSSLRYKPSLSLEHILNGTALLGQYLSKTRR